MPRCSRSYARGLTVRELQAHLEECYQVPVSPDLITAVTDEILPELAAWQQRPLEPVYVAVVFDALRVKIRDEGLVQHKAVYLALGILPSGEKDILGFWLAQTEGATFWQRVMGEPQGRGVRDIQIAMIDGLTGFPAAIAAVFPQTVIHQCVVHLVRQSLQHVSWLEPPAAPPTLPTFPTALRRAHLAPRWKGKYAPLWNCTWRVCALWVNSHPNPLVGRRPAIAT